MTRELPNLQPALAEHRSVSRRTLRSRSTSRWRWALLVSVVLAVIGAVALLRRAPGSTVPPNALIVSPRHGTLTIDIVETGVIQPSERVEIKSKVAGQVVEVRVEPGDAVRRGDLLVRLDPIDYEREVARSAAAIEQARAGVDFARQQLERVRGTVHEQVSPRLELESAVHQLRLSRSSFPGS